jgi:hypothetical protein
MNGKITDLEAIADVRPLGRNTFRLVQNGATTARGMFRDFLAMSTEWASLKPFLCALLNRRHNNVALYFWSPNERPYGDLTEASHVQGQVQPVLPVLLVAHGRLGFQLTINIAKPTKRQFAHRRARVVERLRKDQPLSTLSSPSTHQVPLRYLQTGSGG